MTLLEEPVELRSLRSVGDPLGDAAVAEYFDTIEAREPGVLFGLLVRHTQLPPEDQVPAIRAFFAAARALPTWADAGAVHEGQAFFNRFVSHHFAALYFASLPNAYAAAKGVQVLRMTDRLRTDTDRRLNETGQFLLDIAAPGAMDAGGVGIERILHVRLMHAAVRWLIAHDPNVTTVDDVAPPGRESEGLLWSRSWGVPANQEDLLGTWLTFTEVVYRAFSASGVVVTAADIDGHLHFWRVVAHFLGIEDGLVPTSRASAELLRARIFSEQQSPCGAGTAMTAALVAQAHRRMPRLLWPILPTTFRKFLGDDVADMVGIAPANWTRHLFGLLIAFTRYVTRFAKVNGPHARLIEWMGRHLLNGILSELRGGERPPFAIPLHLAPLPRSRRSLNDA